MGLLSIVEVNKSINKSVSTTLNAQDSSLNKKQHCSLSGAEMSNNTIKSFNSKKSYYII